MRALAIVIIAGMMLSGCLQAPQPPENETGNGTDTGNAITQEMCAQYGGHWNECGSACRGAPDNTPCVLMCVQYCECGGIAGFACPPGYVCTDYLPEGAADAMGICKKVSE